MMRTVEVEVDEAGQVHTVDPLCHLPAGRATLVWDTAGSELFRVSEQALAQDWLRPEEDAAWAYLQPDRS